MIRGLLCFVLILCVYTTSAQLTFKCGWNTYKTGYIVHEYNYALSFVDSPKLYLSDSAKTLISNDSSLLYKIQIDPQTKEEFYEATYLNPKKKVAKVEEYKGKLLTAFKEYKYDDKGRKIQEVSEDKEKNYSYKKTFDYTTDKKTEDLIITEASYFNGRIEFYTKHYYDKSNQKYKEVRYNDNNKDIVHVENYKYNSYGKLKERSVYFPEFKVTKNFEEPNWDIPSKCYSSQVLLPTDKVNLSTRIAFIKRILNKNKLLIIDKECRDFEHKFHSADCELLITSTKTNNMKRVCIKVRQKVVG